MGRNCPQPENRNGLVLITTLLFLLPLTLLLLVAHERVTHRVRVSRDLERQLYSLTLAANGVELVRALLPAMDLGEMLSAAGSSAENRNPVPRSVALSTRLSELDSLVTSPQLSGPDNCCGIWAAVSRGRVLYRLTNNPEEAADDDQDGIVILRSMGVAQAQPWHILPTVLNCVTLVEARFRQERTFDLPAAILLFAASGRFNWSGNRFRVLGGEAPAIAVVSTTASTLTDQVVDSLRGREEVLVTSQSGVEDVTETYQSSAALARIFSATFWAHFLESLPGFVFESGRRGLRYLPEGGTVNRRVDGILIARGPLILAGQAEVTGLLIHLGNGALELRDQTRIVGAVWVSDPDHLTEPDPTPIELHLGDEVEVIYDREQIERALWLFPPTQLGWRIIAPEMEGE